MTRTQNKSFVVYSLSAIRIESGGHARIRYTLCLHACTPGTTTCICSCVTGVGTSGEWAFRCGGRPRAARTKRYACGHPRPPYVIWRPGAVDCGAADGAAPARHPRRPAGRPPCPGARSCAASGGAVRGNSRRTPDTGACPCPGASWHPRRRPSHRRPCRPDHRRQSRRRHHPCGANACGTPGRTSCESLRCTWRTRSATAT